MLNKLYIQKNTWTHALVRVQAGTQGISVL